MAARPRIRLPRQVVWVMALILSLPLFAYGVMKTARCLVGVVVDMRAMGSSVVEALGYQIRHGGVLLGIISLALAAMIAFTAMFWTLRTTRTP